MSKVEQFIAAAMKYKGDKYSQPRRMEKGYSDCSSLVQKALRDIGLGDKIVTTKRMLDGDSRFKLISRSQLRRGDLLHGGSFKNGVWSGHVAIYLGGGKTLEAMLPPRGVVEHTDRAYFDRVYRITALEETKSPKKNVIENVPILIEGKQMPTKGYIVEGVTYIDVKGIAYPVRNFFESLGCEVKWIDNKVQVKL